MTESALNTQSIRLRYINYVDCDLWTSSYLHNCSFSIYWTFVITGCTFCEFQYNSTVTLPNLSLETLMFTAEKLFHKEETFCNNFIDAATNVIIYYHLLGNSISTMWKLKNTKSKWYYIQENAIPMISPNSKQTYFKSYHIIWLCMIIIKLINDNTNIIKENKLSHLKDHKFKQSVRLSGEGTTEMWYIQLCHLGHLQILCIPLHSTHSGTDIHLLRLWQIVPELQCHT